MGIAFAAPPGALTAEAIRRGLAGPGFRAALLVGLGSLIGDAVYALLALAGLAALMDRPLLRLGVGAVGGVVLLWLAWETLRQASVGALDLDRGAARRGSAFLSGMGISPTNRLNRAGTTARTIWPWPRNWPRGKKLLKPGRGASASSHRLSLTSRGLPHRRVRPQGRRQYLRERGVAGGRCPRRQCRKPGNPTGFG